MAEEYPKDSSGRALVVSAIENFERELRSASLDRQSDALDWLAGLDAAHRAARFRPIIESLLRSDVESGLAELQRRKADNEARKAATLDRLLAKRRSED